MKPFKNGKSSLSAIKFVTFYPQKNIEYKYIHFLKT